MYEYNRHRRPARHRVLPRGALHAGICAIICLTLCLCAEGLAELILSLF